MFFAPPALLAPAGVLTLQCARQLLTKLHLHTTQHAAPAAAPRPRPSPPAPVVQCTSCDQMNKRWQSSIPSQVPAALKIPADSWAQLGSPWLPRLSTPSALVTLGIVAWYLIAMCMRYAPAQPPARSGNAPPAPAVSPMSPHHTHLLQFLDAQGATSEQHHKTCLRHSA